MATFSPDTTVKETVNVNYHDRITGQKVVMINRENEFYGTFKGVSELSGSTFVDPTIEGGTLHGTKIVDDDGKALNLSEYAQAIYDLEQTDEDIRSEFADADIALYNRIKAESGESSGGAAKEACDALSVELVGKMELADEAFDFLLQKGFTKEYGARELERVIAQQLKPILMREILFGSLKQGGAIKVKLSNGALTAEP
jgi:hypothetical protein